ncbi:Phenylalanyl-tRNA synthetase, beta subunit, cytoplasmic [Umbelopsis sp. WA50703]
MSNQDDLQNFVLTTLDKQGVIEDSANLKTANGADIDQLALLGALNSLRSKDMLEYKAIEREVWTLTEEGRELADSGSHEARVFEAVPAGEEGITIPELQAKLGKAASIGQGKAFKNKWITKQPPNKLVRIVDSIVDQTQIDLRQIQSTGTLSDAKLLADLKKRKLADKQKLVSYNVTKGPEFSLEIKKEATDITYEMLQSGEWKDASFKKYNFDAVGIPPSGGHLHPLMKVRQEFREIFFEMGFEEMPTNRFVESSFWNFDALFQPQQHPARDAHDTFFIKDPATTDRFPKDLMEKIKVVHENGGDTGSIGYDYNWKQEEAEKLILRTHTTAVSSYMLYKLAEKAKKDGEFRPAKYFSIDRVFRNESVDATHLAEFHQIEGVIADKNLSLADLIGFMDVFFKKMGMDKIRFKPTYNPYTEPSMEIFSWHDGLKTWVEIGNSGMFRPEMLLPLGLPPDVRVIAWGLGLERPTMVKYGISNIRDLLGHKVNLAMIRDNAVCRLDKKMGKELIGINLEEQPEDSAKEKITNAVDGLVNKVQNLVVN